MRTNRLDPKSPTQTAYLLEGDIILTLEEIEQLYALKEDKNTNKGKRQQENAKTDQYHTFNLVNFASGSPRVVRVLGWDEAPYDLNPKERTAGPLIITMSKTSV